MIKITSEVLKQLNTQLNADDIEMRTGSVGNGWMTILAYKTARVDANVLDRVLGAENWCNEYEHIDGVVYCKVSVMTEHGWVTKVDCGEPDKQGPKGTASDAFKRACFKWGIGRELYDYPFMYVKLEPNEFQAKKVGKGHELTREAKFNQWTIEKEGDKVFVKDSKGKQRCYGEISGGKGKDVQDHDTSGEVDKSNTLQQKEDKIDDKQISIIDKSLSGIRSQDELKAYASDLVSRKLWNEKIKQLFTNRKEELNGN